MAGAKQRNPGIRRIGRGEAGTLLLRAGTECEKRQGQSHGRRFNDLSFRIPRENYSSRVNPTRKVT